MTALAQHVADYLAIRRGLGFKLHIERRMLADFVAFMAGVGQSTVTVDVALQCATNADRRRPRLPGAADARGPRLRALPARDRPGDRDPAARALAGAPSPPDAAHLHRAADRGADGGRQDAAPGAARRHDRDGDRATGLHRAAGRRGIRVGPSRHRRDQPAAADPRQQVRQGARGPHPRQHARRAARVSGAPRRAAPYERPGLRVRLKPGRPPEPQSDAAGVRPGPPSRPRHRCLAGPLARGA